MYTCVCKVCMCMLFSDYVSRAIVFALAATYIFILLCEMVQLSQKTVHWMCATGFGFLRWGFPLFLFCDYVFDVVLLFSDVFLGRSSAVKLLHNICMICAGRIFLFAFTGDKYFMRWYSRGVVESWTPTVFHSFSFSCVLISHRARGQCPKNLLPAK